MKEPASTWFCNATLLRDPNRAASRLRDILVLTKARVNLLVVATAYVGFALHSDVLSNWLLLLNTLLGTGLVAGGAAAANQTLEWRHDQNMARTCKRPIAGGRFSRRAGLLVSAIFLLWGCAWLGLAVNVRAMLIAFLTFLIYVFAYTPLKRVSAGCVLVGAIAGALPVLIGWAATGAGFSAWAAVAFLTLFLWQVPHFLAIAWWCKRDYTRAGYQVLPVDDQRGYRTAGLALLFAAGTVAVAWLPAGLRLVSSGYGWCGAGLGAVFLLSVIWFFLKRSSAAAHLSFIVSLLYLPFAYLLMLACRA